MSGPTMHPGTVVRYTPDPSRFEPRWCREGTAIADGRGLLFDTYWSSGSEAHQLTEGEIATTEVRFNLADYVELDRYQPASSQGAWLTYHPDDRQLVTSQHGLERRWFVRKGAEPHLGTRIDNAREALEEAESKLRSAQGDVEWKRDALAELEAQAVPS